MTAATVTLAEFLLARIEEDERVARYLTSDYAQHKPTWRNPSTGVVDIGDPGLDGLQPLGDGPLASHIARWDPARVLAECEAKRRIVRLWDLRLSDGGYPLGGEAAEVYYDTIRALALSYTDHPDYRSEWRP